MIQGGGTLRFHDLNDTALLGFDLSNTRVGVLTTAPLTPLDVKQSSTGAATANAAFRDSSTNGNALQIWNGNNEARFRAVYYGTPSDQAITFYTITSAGSEGERMRITGAGLVGIGTNSPSSNLQINGNNATVFDASVDSGQDDGGVTLTIRNNDISTAGSFSQINMMVSGDSGRALGRIVTIRTASATSDIAFVTERENAKAERIRITSDGVLRFSNVPFNNYHLDTSTPIAISSGGTIPFETFSGMIIINNMSNGVCAMWLVGAGGVSLIGQSAGGATGTMSYSSGINGYVWTAAQTANYGVFAVRTRANA
jgi:hypothetical protein